MSKVDILFVDLLYKPKGSFDDDYASISKSMDGRRILHLKVEKKGYLRPLLLVVSSAYRLSPGKVVFLSAKIWQLIFLAPLRFFCPIYAIYHFRPNIRARMHDRMLPLLSRVYKFAAYSESVRQYLCVVTGLNIPIVASRLIDKRRSIELMIKKLEKNVVKVFCPGVKQGIRLPMNYDELKQGIEKALARRVGDLVVQDVDRALQQDCTGVSTWVPPMLAEDDYARLYDEALIIAMKFYPEYEARSSAMINDSLGKGCIVVTNAHPITLQYGYPKGFVTDIEHLPSVIESVRNGSLGPEQIPGFDYMEARISWINFLKLGA